MILHFFSLAILCMLISACGGGTAGGSRCNSQADCAADQVCTAGMCVPRSQNDCTEDSQCGADRKCVDGKCVVVGPPPCASDQDCGEGKKCTEGHCIDENSECGADADCPEGYTCNPATKICGKGQCTDGSDCSPPNPLCLQGSCVGCITTGCPEGNACNQATGYCEARGSAAVGQPCLMAVDCIDETAECIQWPGGYCRIPCAGGGCPPGSVCANIEDGQYCLDDCGSNSDCRSPDYICVQGEAGRFCFLHCSHLSCGPGKQCNQATGICDSIASQAAAGGQCGENFGNCQQGLSCLGTPGSYYCYSACDPTLDPFCNEVEVCLSYGGGATGICLFGGAVQSGGDCSEDSLSCGRGMICVTVSETETICLQACDTQDNSPGCTMPRQCLQLRDSQGNFLRIGVCH